MIQLWDYPTRPVCLEALEIVRRHFCSLQTAIPPARWVPWNDEYNWRFVERLPEQLLLQKLARQITGVQTIDLLLMSGYLQEVGVLYRTLDEIAEDIAFVCSGMRTGKWNHYHEDYVKYFWSEEEADKQPPVRRKNIRSYNNRSFDNPNPSRDDSAGRRIYKTYSDYAHARSAPIMAMVHGPPAQFQLDGIHDMEARYPYVEQNPAYFYRCLASACMIANAVLPDRERLLVYAETKDFEKRNGNLLF